MQRVSSARVRVDGAGGPAGHTGEVVGEIGEGLCVLVGVTHDDDEAKAAKLADKVWNLRVFPDDAGQMNVAVGSVGGAVLVVSQFTLYGDTRRGNRPSFVAAASAEHAEPLYERFCARAGARRGAFGAQMAVELVNHGPVTLLLEG